MDKHLTYEINELSRWHDKPVLATIYDCSATLLASSNYNAKLMNLTSQQLVGLNIDQITTEQIQWLMPDINQVEITQIKNSLLMLSKLLQIIIIEEIPISYLNFMPLGGIRKPFIELASPIFGEHGDIVGIKIIATEYSLYGQNEYFKQLCQANPSTKPQVTAEKIYPQTSHKTKINLAERQLEIVYLLANGFTQSEVAQILNISRGSVASIVSTQICAKFNIAGSSTKLLIDKATALGLNQSMPPSLHKPFIIILDKNIVERYF